MFGSPHCCCSGRDNLLLLTDCTGSMGSHLAGVKACWHALKTIWGPGFGWGAKISICSYKDDGRSPIVNQKLTDNMELVTNAINGLTAGGGGDEAENYLESLLNIAENWESSTIGGSSEDRRRCIVICGDAKSHQNVTCEEVADALDDAGILLIGLNIRPLSNGLDQVEECNVPEIQNIMFGAGEILTCHEFNTPEQDCDCGFADFWIFVHFLTDTFV